MYLDNNGVYMETKEIPVRYCPHCGKGNLFIREVKEDSGKMIKLNIVCEDCGQKIQYIFYVVV